MIHDSAPHRVFNIAELTMLIVNQVVLTSQKSAVNLACACRHLEEPVLSALWETQHSFRTLLEVLPEEAWGLERRPAEYAVRGLVLSEEESNAQASRRFRSISWGSHHPKIGTKSGAMRLGCANSTWMSGRPMWSPPNFASIPPPAGGSQHCAV